MPDALDSAAEALSRRLLATAPADRPRTALDVDGLPAPVARLLHARLALAVDDAAPRASDWVGGADVEAAAGAWREAAARAVRFPAAAWADAVRQAVRLALAHLVRPAATLADAAFEGEAGALPVAVALDRTRAFGPYPYLPQIAARYAERKGVEALGRDEFAGLLQRIDRRMVSTFGPSDWMTLLGPLFSLVGPVGSPPGSVPTGLLRPLFAARGADALAGTLDGLDAVTADELRQRLGAVLAPDSDAPSPASTAPERASPPLALDAPDAHPATRELTPADEPDAAPDADTSAPEPPTPPADAPSAPPVADDLRPPTIGSKYHAPEYDEVDESAVLGPARPTAAADDAPEPETVPSDGMDEVRDAVAPPPPDPPAPEVPVLDLPAEAPAPAGPPVPADAPAAPTPAEAHEDEEEPLWQRIARTQASADVAPPEAAPAEPSPPQAPPAGDADDDEPLWKRFAASELAQKLPTPPRDLPPDDLGDGPASPTLDALEARVLGRGARDRRDWFVEELFDGSPGAYHRTLDRLDRAASYSEATHIVSADIFRAHHVNPWTDSAVAFIDALQSQFEARR